MKTRGRLGAVGTIGVLVTMAGCCFTETHSEVTTTVTEPPVDPALDALWVCPSSEVGTGDHCPAPNPVLPSSTFNVGVTFRTHDLPRFANSPVLVVYTGEGATRDELGRIPMEHSSGRVPPPGEILTWDVYEELIAPRRGWPVSTPVHIDLLDAANALVTSATVTFAGPQTPRPPDRPVGQLIVCRTDALSGPDDDHFCPTPLATVPYDATQEIWVTYSSSDPTVWASPMELTLERQGRHGWVHEATDTLAPITLEPFDLETLRGHYAMNQAAFASGSTLRFTLTSGATQIAQTMFTTQ